jgi:hypothetical protein
MLCGVVEREKKGEHRQTRKQKYLALLSTLIEISALGFSVLGHSRPDKRAKREGDPFCTIEQKLFTWSRGLYRQAVKNVNESYVAPSFGRSSPRASVPSDSGSCVHDRRSFGGGRRGRVLDSFLVLLDLLSLAPLFLEGFLVRIQELLLPVLRHLYLQQRREHCNALTVST